MAHDVFISYAHHDKAVADAVCAKLEQHLLRCWIAPRDVAPGAEWAGSIIHAINDTLVMVLVFSSKANESQQIRREVERAVNKGVIIVPFRIEDVVPTGSLEYFMSNVHRLDALTPPLEKHVRNLADVVKAMLERMPSRNALGSAVPIQPGALSNSTTLDSDLRLHMAAETARHSPAGPQPQVATPATRSRTPRGLVAAVIVGLVLLGIIAVVSVDRHRRLVSAEEQALKQKDTIQVQARENSTPIGQVDVKTPVSPPQSQEDHSPTDHTGVLAPTSPEAKSTLNAGGGINWGNEELASVLKAANAGDAKAQVEIANRYFYALNGVGKDYSQAVAWYRKAADQGSAVGQSGFGFLYETGHGVPRDYAQALFWYRKAADQGSAVGQNNLGTLYQTGHGLPQDYAQALFWFRKAADQGSAVGQNNLGTLYQTGRGLPQDSAQALFWFRKAADQGDAFADINLGIMYENGQGVTKDLAQARMWYRKAADQGNEDAKRRLAALVVQH